MTAAVQVLGQVVNLPVDRVRPGRNWRGVLRDVEQLATSIRRVGLLEEITVADDGDGWYTVFEGHRRLAAVKQLRREVIAARIRVSPGDDRALLQLAIHTQRAAFDPVAQATVIAWEMFERPDGKRSREEVAEAIGKSPAWVAGRLQLLKLQPHERDDVAAGRMTVTAALQTLRAREEAVRSPVVRRPVNKQPSVSAGSAPTVLDPAVVKLRRIQVLVGECVGCACCRAVGALLDAS